MSADWPFRIVAAPGGTVLLDVDDGAAYAWVADSFVVSTQDSSSSTGTQTTPVQTQIDERYGGMRTDYEQRSNGTLSWTAFVRGSSSASLAANVAQLTAIVDSAADTYIERADPGWSGSLFYERRGAGLWTQTMLDPYQFMATIDIALPIAPAAQGLPITTSATITLPGEVVLGAIPGTLPALVDVAVDLPASPFAWALVAPTAPLASPFGLVVGPGLTEVGMTLATDAGAMSGHSWQNTTANVGGVVSTAIDPSLVTLDAFERDIAVEVWIRCKYNAAQIPGAILSLGATPPGGVGAVRGAADFPSGRPIGDAAAGAIWRIHRAGILRLPSQSGSGTWNISADIIVAGGSTLPVGGLAIDYLMLVPARHRACSPTGVALSAGGYPRLLATTAAQTKTIRRDGSGLVSLPAGVAHSDTGLGGSLLTIMPGPSGLVTVAASPAVPDDPSAGAGNDTFVTAAAVRVTVTPRYSLWSAP